MAQTKTESPNFEAAIKRLDEITASMEKENISLEESLRLYEEGIRLVREANERLEDAERRIRILKMTADGEIAEADFLAEQAVGKDGDA